MNGVAGGGTGVTVDEDVGDVHAGLGRLHLGGGRHGTAGRRAIIGRTRPGRGGLGWVATAARRQRQDQHGEHGAVPRPAPVPSSTSWHPAPLPPP